MRFGQVIGAFALLVSLFGAQAARGQSATEALDFTVYQPFVSARALGMGNAFTAVADDYSALFYNPAGLARLKQSETNLEIRAMVDADVLSLESQVSQASSAGNNVTQLENLLAQDMGHHYSARLPTIGGYYVRPHWGIALIPADLTLELGINQLVGPAADVVATEDTTLAFGYGWNAHLFKHDQLSFGFTAKGIYRAYYNRVATALQLATDSQLIRVQDAQEGFTADADIGMLYTPPPRRRGFFSVFKPTFGLVVRNVADYGFPTNFHLVSNGTTVAPPPLQRRLDVGTTFELPDWWVWHSRLAFDIRDIGYDTWTLRKGTHAGVEFLWKVRSWFRGGWRGGINEGYWTAGFTGKFLIFQLDLATYGEEVGPQNAPLEDRRYMAKTSLDW